jgi:protein-L-isoaspartate(D-aspartate) O-methyltransferase
MDEMEFSKDRHLMVDEQLRQRGIQDQRVLGAFETVPRHLFVRQDDQAWSYKDYPHSIGFGQTISQPYIVALMTECLKLSGDEKVLEVGTGSGYQAAILAELAREVHTIEIVPELSERARDTFLKSSYQNIHLHIGDGSMGLPEFSPYDGILVTAAAPRAPRPLLDQLADNGRLILPVGSKGFQELELWRRNGDNFSTEIILPVTFVPLLGQHGWGKGWF